MQKLAPQPANPIANLTRDADRLLGELQAESDRGAALLAVAFIDDVLDAVLRARFIDDAKAVYKLMGPGRPVESFGTRVHLSYCIGLLGLDIYNDLNLIREIRNEFAHRAPMNFEAEQIAERIAQLRTADLFGPAEMSGREKFLVTVVLIVDHLTTIGREITHITPAEQFSKIGTLRLR